MSTYQFDDNTQLSPHFNAREFRCQCGQPHETLIASEYWSTSWNSFILPVACISDGYAS